MHTHTYTKATQSIYYLYLFLYFLFSPTYMHAHTYARTHRHIRILKAIHACLDAHYHKNPRYIGQFSHTDTHRHIHKQTERQPTWTTVGRARLRVGVSSRAGSSIHWRRPVTCTSTLLCTTSTSQGTGAPAAPCTPATINCLDKRIRLNCLYLVSLTFTYLT